MLLELTTLNQLPVGSFDEGGLIGKVTRSIISYDEGKLLGFEIKRPGLFSKTKIATLEDIISIDQGAVVIRSQESLVDSDEIVRVSQILKSNFHLIGLKAQDKEGVKLGAVDDALIDSDTGKIMRLYVKKMFSSYVFERSQIVEITLKNVILKVERVQKSASWRKKTAADLAQAEVA